MSSQNISNKIDAWFVDTATSMMYIDPADVTFAIRQQDELRIKQGRNIRLWEVFVMQGKVSLEQVDHILDTLGQGSKSDGEDGRLTLLGRVLVDVGYAQGDDIHKALEKQAAERASGTWRLLGQILIEDGVIISEQLQDALAVLEQRRKAR